ncbi:MAG: hypothetical protein AABY22_27465, partial [Nanoarchaeota archaeon]
EDPKNFLLFQQKRMSAFLFKSFLTELEDLRNVGIISEEYFEKRRKWILDAAGNSSREFEEYLNKFDIRFKNVYNKIYNNEK